MKEAVPEVGILCDVALDPYTSHGHDGIVRDGRHRQRTRRWSSSVARRSFRHVPAATSSAPSDMMDGRVACIARRWTPRVSATR